MAATLTDQGRALVNRLLAALPPGAVGGSIDMIAHADRDDWTISWRWKTAGEDRHFAMIVPAQPGYREPDLLSDAVLARCAARMLAGPPDP